MLPLVLLASSPIALAQSMVVAPYLQSPTPESIWILWETSSGEESIVEWGETATGGAATGSGASRIHSAQIAELAPDTTYHYRARTGAAVSEIARFRTPADPTAEADYCWRARYRDRALSWSDWSEPIAFRTGEATAIDWSDELLSNPGAEQGDASWTVEEGVLESLADGECGMLAPPRASAPSRPGCAPSPRARLRASRWTSRPGPARSTPGPAWRNSGASSGPGAATTRRRSSSSSPTPTAPSWAAPRRWTPPARTGSPSPTAPRCRPGPAASRSR